MLVDIEKDGQTALLSVTFAPPLFCGTWVAAALAAGSVVNLVRAGDSGTYSDLTAPLSHTWSLGVEEQFYFAWPLLLLVLLRHATWTAPPAGTTASTSTLTSSSHRTTVPDDATSLPLNPGDRPHGVCA
ncbi:hypothetical protein [Streptomyces sp. NPDC051572]|uniref:hypothetical protein n=1 Tax=unclassified Streptomyces TaxID=2593676 RepID=UPI00344EDEBF